MSFFSRYSLKDVIHILRIINQKADRIMALVQVEQSALDELDVALDEATAAISDRIQALIDAGSLPAADVSALQADVENLRALSAPPAVEPPADEPVA